MVIPSIKQFICYNMCTSGRTAEWQYGSMAVWQNGRMAERQNGRMAEWQNGMALLGHRTGLSSAVCGLERMSDHTPWRMRTQWPLPKFKAKVRPKKKKKFALLGHYLLNRPYPDDATHYVIACVGHFEWQKQ